MTQTIAGICSVYGCTFRDGACIECKQPVDQKCVEDAEVARLVYQCALANLADPSTGSIKRDLAILRIARRDYQQAKARLGQW